MKALVPLYYILAHFWITTPDPNAKPMVMHVHSQAMPSHLEGETCTGLAEAMVQLDKEEPEKILLGDTKTLLDYYSCLPVFIDKDKVT